MITWMVTAFANNEKEERWWLLLFHGTLKAKTFRKHIKGDKKL